MSRWVHAFATCALFLLLSLIACGHTATLPPTPVATDAPMPTSLTIGTIVPPPREISPVEEEGSGTTCPDGYPIKADDATRTYFRPDQRLYSVTSALHCFVSETTARAAGYQASVAA